MTCFHYIALDSLTVTCNVLWISHMYLTSESIISATFVFKGMYSDIRACLNIETLIPRVNHPSSKYCKKNVSEIFKEQGL